MDNLVKIKDVCQINSGSYSKKDKWTYIKYLDTGSITQNKIYSIQYINLNKEKLPARARRKVSHNSIIYSSVRPNQLHYGIIQENIDNLLVSTGFVVIDADENVVNPEFLYYYLTQNSIVEYLQSVGEQSVSAYPSIKPSDIGNLEIKLLSLREQNIIAQILGSIDRKIRINEKINDNLEMQIRCLFRYLFIDFNNERQHLKASRLGFIPSNFKVVKNKEIPMIVTDYVANGSFASLKENVRVYQEKNYAYFIRNTDLKTNNFNTFVDKSSYEFLSKSKLCGGEIIISNVGDVGSVFLCPVLDSPMTLGNNIIMIKPKKEEMKYYLYAWFKWFHGQGLIQGIKGGSAQPKFNKTDFKNLPILVPDNHTLNKFNEIASPIFASIEINQKENKIISKYRDLLLPKLMSGELNIANIILKKI